MRRLAFSLGGTLFCLLLAQAVHAAPPVFPLRQEASVQAPRLCRVPDLAVQGMGGTGAPVAQMPNNGMGGTGAPGAVARSPAAGAPGEDSGLGGTGLTAQRAARPGEGEGGGIGGTGLSADASAQQGGGLGGTGAPAGWAQGGGRQAVPPGPGPDRDGMGGTGIRSAGWVSELSGTLLVTDTGGRSMLLGKGQLICPGDRLETGEGTTARLDFRDGGRLFLRAQTRLRLEQYTWDEFVPQQGSMQLVLAEGGVRSVSGRLTKGNPDGYRMRAPDADIRVLGTDYEVVHVKVATPETAPGTYASVSSGRISLENSSGRVLLKAGQAAVVKLNRAPQRLSSKPSCLICR